MGNATYVKVPRKGRSQTFFEAIYPGTSQKITTATASSTQSAAVGSNTTLVKVAMNTAGFVAVGANPTANNSTSMYVPANLPVFIPCAPSDKVAVIADATAGSAFITEAQMGSESHTG